MASSIKLTDDLIRKWILNDQGLYLWAREGHDSDNAMYEALPRFIKKNRAELKRRINEMLNNG